MNARVAPFGEGASGPSGSTDATPSSGGPRRSGKSVNVKRLEARIRGLVGKAIADYRMIEDGDRVMACVSGGKDSHVMLDMLTTLARSAPVKFEVVAVNLDQKQPGFPDEVLPEYFASRAIPFEAIEQDTYSVVKRVLPEGKTMCGLCSRLRRGVLYRYATERGFTRIALGHHRDDIVETLFMNMFHGGRLRAMPPKLLSDDGRHVVIRPLAYCAERDLDRFARAMQVPHHSVQPLRLAGRARTPAHQGDAGRVGTRVAGSDGADIPCYPECGPVPSRGSCVVRLPVAVRLASVRCPSAGRTIHRTEPHRMSRRVIAVLHDRDSTPGKVGERLVARGFEIDARSPCHGDSLPESMSGYTAAIVFGGAQSANDDHDPGIRAELDWMETALLPSGKPALGICLGAQQIARVLGARVSPHPDGLVEIGYHEVRPTGRCPHFLPAPTMFYQWHAEMFEIPRDAEHLAENTAFPGQAFRYRGNVYGIEFHPEMTRAMIESWCGSGDGSARLDHPNAQSRERQLEGYVRYSDASDRWLDAFLDGFLSEPVPKT